MATNSKKKDAGSKGKTYGAISGKATMHNVSRFDDDGYGIYNVREPGDNKKKNTARKK